MRDDPVIRSLETLRDDAETRMTTAQGQSLVLAYMNSLLRRRDIRLMALEEMRDEVSIALALRAPPVFRFVEESPIVQSKNIIALRGEVKFGAQALATHAFPKGRLERVD